MSLGCSCYKTSRKKGCEDDKNSFQIIALPSRTETTILEKGLTAPDRKTTTTTTATVCVSFVEIETKFRWIRTETLLRPFFSCLFLKILFFSSLLLSFAWLRPVPTALRIV